VATTWVSGIGYDDRLMGPVPEPATAELDWSDLFARHHVHVHAFVRSRVPAAWVDDTVQDTFVRAYKSRHRLDPTRPVWPWLVTIARRACIETCRNHRAEVSFDGSLHSGVAPDDPHLEFERRQRATAIAGALEALPPRHRRLLIRYEVEGRSYAVLAGEEAISGQALKSVLCRARESFRARYEALAEVNGLAALPVLGPLLVRVRTRWSRGHDTVSRMSPELAGALFVGLTATAWIVGVPTAQRAASAPAMANVVMVGDALGTSVPGTVPVLPPLASAPPDRPGPPAAEAPLGTRQPPNDRGSGGSLVPRASSDASVVTTPNGSEITVRVDFSVVTGDGRNVVTITTACGAVSAPICRAVNGE
jgi:RNA polymerase sigma-70 factor (ECF subfamily)